MVSSPKREYFGILQCWCSYDNLWSRETTYRLHSDDALQVGRLSLNKVIHSAAVKKGFLKDMPLSRFHRRKVKYVNHRWNYLCVHVCVCVCVCVCVWLNAGCNEEKWKDQLCGSGVYIISVQNQSVESNPDPWPTCESMGMGNQESDTLSALKKFLFPYL